MGPSRITGCSKSANHRSLTHTLPTNYTYCTQMCICRLPAISMVQYNQVSKPILTPTRKYDHSTIRCKDCVAFCTGNINPIMNRWAVIVSREGRCYCWPDKT